MGEEDFGVGGWWFLGMFPGMEGFGVRLCNDFEVVARISPGMAGMGLVL